VPALRQVEQLRGENCESLLRHLGEHDLLEKVSDVAASVRLISIAYTATGHATVESLQPAPTLAQTSGSAYREGVSPLLR
jgi:hypothetical protein